jgi:hypothetical protein
MLSSFALAVRTISVRSASRRERDGRGGTTPAEYGVDKACKRVFLKFIPYEILSSTAPAAVRPTVEARTISGSSKIIV